FYADLDGDWTDEQVNNSSAAFARNHNLIGDGKYDQSALPSKVELAVGRIDFFDMPAFKKDEIALMRQYLQRLHLFKTGQLAVQRRSLVDDHLGSVLGAPAASAYRNFAAMFGATQIHTGDYFTDMATEDYLWSYGAGGGSHVSADGIGRTSDFARVPLQNIFTMLCGSQFGDWDNTDNFLRAPLAGAGHTLASCWVGNPPWTLHQMALGQYIGYCLRQTQNATIDDYHPGPQLVHTALMGDPTLRLHPVAMPREVSAVMDNEDVLLTWKPSADTSVLGYHVYRRHPSHSSYERLSAAPIRNTQFWDKNPSAFPVQYLVKAVKLEQSGSGTYYNLSLGAAATAIATTVVSERNSDDENWVIYPNPTTGHIVLQDKTGIQVADRPEVYDSTGRLLHELRVHAESNWRLDLSSGVYFIKWKGQTKTIVVVEP
ncbi:MAG: T9SS type A sorting domain-containing protein, partial [Bacteroidota bacterium]